ncbi:MAG: hypothetical protein MZV70_46050 [Desulfobacterales bacterium]|nr:hypothetical protein [Desulfobacterales bacterium]
MIYHLGLAYAQEGRNGQGPGRAEAGSGAQRQLRGGRTRPGANGGNEVMALSISLQDEHERAERNEDDLTAR